MTAQRVHPRSRHVVIVGDGIAAVEAVLALKDLGHNRLRLTLVAPKPRVALKPLVGATAPAPVGVPSFAELLSHHDDRLVCDTVVDIDTDAKLVRCATKPVIAYDDLLLAQGAPKQRSGPGAGTCSDDTVAVDGLIADVEHGYCRFIAFVVPSAARWPLAIYEIALKTAHRAWDMCIDNVDLTLISHEATPLALFGEEASRAVGAHLAASGIRFVGGVDPQVAGPGRVRIGPGMELTAQRVVTLPMLEGPSLSGLPSDAQGRVPVDQFARVPGVQNVWAAGAASDVPFMHAALACGMADVAAAGIAAAAGAAIEVQPLPAAIRGRVVAGTRRGTSAMELWGPRADVAGRHLTARLASPGSPPIQRDAYIDVELALHSPPASAESRRTRPLGEDVASSIAAQSTPEPQVAT
jgi:sulfide:quinone oxidoreductase